MGSFEQKIDEFNKFIIDKIDTVSMMMSNANNGEEGNKSLKRILSPQTESEINGAKAAITMFEDLQELVFAIGNDKVKKTPFEENSAMKILIDNIQAVKDGKTVNTDIYNNLSAKEYAKYMYDLITGLLCNIDKCIDYIFKIINIDIDDEDEVDIMNQKISTILNSMQSTTVGKPIEECTDEDIEKVVEIAIEFHILCKKNIIKDDTKQKGYKKEHN